MRRSTETWRAARTLAPLAMLTACAPADQEPVRTVAVIEIVLDDPRDRPDLLAILRRHAPASGLHVDASDSRALAAEQEAGVIPPAYRATFDAGVWYGAEDEEAVAFADDRVHRGRARVRFLRGVRPDRFRAYRDATLADLRRRWPHASVVPPPPSGDVSLTQDLAGARNGNAVQASAGERHGPGPSAPASSTQRH